jgi:hypothetical protein
MLTRPGYPELHAKIAMADEILERVERPALANLKQWIKESVSWSWIRAAEEAPRKLPFLLWEE